MKNGGAGQLRIGVTGHRSDKLDPAAAAALRPGIAAVLRDLKGQAALQVVSALAEGSDRLVAAEAIAMGAALLALLPFARDLYEDDFDTAESRREFHALLDRAAAVIELDGNPATPPGRTAAYAAVGEAVADRCDVLFAIWNGEPAAGRGGTAEIVAYAQRHRRPVLWFTPAQPHNRPTLLLWDRRIEENALGALLSLVRIEGA